MKNIFKKIWRSIKSGWDYLDGNKTWMGLGMHTAWFVANLVFGNLATPTEVGIGHAIIGSWTGVGIGHKVVKNKDKISEAINKLKK